MLVDTSKTLSVAESQYMNEFVGFTVVHDLDFFY